MDREQPDVHDAPGHGRPGGVDDPVPDAEYGDVQGEHERPAGPSEGKLLAAIEDQARDLRTTMEANPAIEETKTTMWGIRAIRHLAALEADRPDADAPAWEREAYEHERAATLASIANDLLQAAGYSDVVSGEERGQLQVAKHASGTAVADHYHAAHGIRRQGREDDHA